jgi:hypothetical protein
MGMPVSISYSARVLKRDLVKPSGVSVEGDDRGGGGGREQVSAGGH